MQLIALASVGLLVVLVLILVTLLVRYLYREFGGGLPSPYAPVAVQTPQPQPPQPPGWLIPNTDGITVFNPDVPRPREPGTTVGLSRLPDEDPPRPGSDSGNLILDITDIPSTDVGCVDQFSSCAAWSANGECTINPEFMLENCPHSCSRCGLNREQKNRVISHYLGKPPAKCLTRGVAYPAYYKLISAAYDTYI